MIVGIIILIILHIVLYSLFSSPSKPKKNHVYHQLILLGSPCLADGSLSKAQLRRIHAALHYYQNGYGQTIIISGGSVKNAHSEASTMANELRKYIYEAEIKIEENACNTFQNMKFTSIKYPNDDVLIISGSAHLRRSYFFARKFYKHVALGYGIEKDPFYFYLFEYMRMWNALYWEVKLYIRKKI